MKFIAFLALLIFSTSSFAGVHEGGIHTDNFCSTTNASVCTHLRFEKWPTSTEASEFVVHIQTPSQIQVTNIGVKLWMDMNGHGHGSSPVKIEAMDELNHFYIQDAYFVMKGKWQVIVSFTYNGVSEKIIVPIQIKE